MVSIEREELIQKLFNAKNKKTKKLKGKIIEKRETLRRRPYLPYLTFTSTTLFYKNKLSSHFIHYLLYLVKTLTC